jgi:8-oxo-dGTP diphosphatase
MQHSNFKHQTAAIQVAVGVIHGEQGQVLFTQRPKGKPYAGWWEFPGGKLENNETIPLALARELREELNIQILDCTVWLHQDYEYSHAQVKLHTCSVFNFTGDITGLENQAFQWGYSHNPPQPFLPAALPVLKALQLPSILYKHKDGFDNLPSINQPYSSLHWNHAALSNAYSTQFKRDEQLVWLSCDINNISDLQYAHSLGCDFVVMKALHHWGDLSEQLLNINIPLYVDVSHLSLEANFSLSLARASGALGIVTKK